LANPHNETGGNGSLIVWGRAEVFNGSVWNQICDDDFTANNAKVICRSLGLPFGHVEFANAQVVKSESRVDIL
jgi:hypothetical protein